MTHTCSSRRWGLSLASVAWAGFLAVTMASCGGGSSSSPSSSPVLQVLAVEGEPLPGPTAGTFGFFFPVPIDASTTGEWAAFAATAHSGPSTFQVVYAVDPAGSLVEAFVSGTPALAPSDGFVTGFSSVWVNANGIVLAYANISSDTSGRTWGVYSARISGGVAIEHQVVVYDGDPLAGVGLTGTLTLLDPGTSLFAANDRLYFLGGSSGGTATLLSVLRTGGALSRHLATGDALPGTGGTLTSIQRLGIDPTGARFAFAGQASVGEERLYTGQTTATGFQEIAQDGDPLPTSGTLQDVYSQGPLVVYAAGQVIWRGTGSASTSDTVLLGGDPTTFVVIARTGDSAPGATGGSFGDLILLPQDGEARFPYFITDVSGATNGITVGVYGVTLVTEPPALALFNGRATASGEALGTTFPGVGSYSGAGPASHLAMLNQFASGLTGLVWLIPDVNFFEVGKVGAPAVGGETFSFFEPGVLQGTDGQVLFGARISPSDDTVLFRSLF